MGGVVETLAKIWTMSFSLSSTFTDSELLWGFMVEIIEEASVTLRRCCGLD